MLVDMQKCMKSNYLGIGQPTFWDVVFDMYDGTIGSPTFGVEYPVSMMTLLDHQALGCSMYFVSICCLYSPQI